MGRQLKRVPLNFAWPLKKTWGGYINPFYRQRIDCPSCGGSGQTERAKLFSDQWYGNAPFDPAEYGAKPLTPDHPALVEFAKRQVDRSPEHFGTGHLAVERECRRLHSLWHNQWSHHLIQEDVDALIKAGRLHDFKRAGNETPTAEEVNNWSILTMGHDAINQWVCVGARCEREVVDEECPVCLGSGDLWPSEGVKVACEEWEQTEPPTGEGFQLWETTSEGSPVSPVFESLRELCDWCAENATTFGSNRATSDEWRDMLDDGLVYHKEGSAIFL